MKINKMHLIIAIFIGCLIASNTIATKIFDFKGYYLPAGILVFPITYIIGDVITEVYGYKRMRSIILLGFLANLITTLFIFISIQLPPAPFWDLQDEYEAILSQTPRILVASMVGFLIGSLSNSWSMDYIKKATNERYLWLRTIASTIIGEGLDTLIFIIIAFSAVFDNDHLFDMIITQWIFKVAYESLATPLTYFVINTIKKQRDS